jgi:hypothetical protein
MGGAAPRACEDATMNERTPRFAQPGQILVMFAVVSVAMIGMLGLATDLGFSFVARRTMQNAADAGALAGARIVAKAASSGPMSAIGDVTTIVNSNAFAGAVPTIESCQYVNDVDAELGSCSGSVPKSATGVKVTVREVHPTFFLRVLPGAPTEVTVRATAIAKVYKAHVSGDGPFIVCGIKTELASGGTQNILRQGSSGKYEVDPSAYGQEFQIHAPGIADCKAQGNSFKGLNDQDANSNKSLPPDGSGVWFGYDTGVKAGPTRSEVKALGGCAKGQPANNCIVYLPVAVDATGGPKKSVKVVIFAAFYITEPKVNEHNGRLVPDLIVYEAGSLGWTPDYAGPITVRLSS